MMRKLSLFWVMLIWIAPAPLCVAADIAAGPPTPGLVNGSFDSEASNPARPPGWASQGSAHGTARVVERAGATGGHAIEMEVAPGGSSGAAVFMLYQVLDLSTFRGQEVEFGGRVATDGAGINMTLWSPEGHGNEFASDVNNPAWVEYQNTFQVPAAASMLTFGVQVIGPGGSKAWVDEVYVKLASSPEPAATTAQVTIQAGSVVRELPEEFFGMHIEWVADARGIVKPGTGTPRADVLALLEPLDIKLLRYPGGINADFYDWEKGVGGQRGSIRNPFTKKLEVVRFGSEEFIGLVNDLKAKGCITANYGTGTAAEAVAWAKWFKRRDFSPFCWEIGNEIYLSGPKATGANSSEIYHTGKQYADDFPAFSAGIKGVFPGVMVGAIAHVDDGAFSMGFEDPNWTKDMLSALTTKADFFALHNGYAPVMIPGHALDVSVEANRQRMYRAMFAAPLQTKGSLAAVAEEIKKRSPVNASTPFAITEFGELTGIAQGMDDHLIYVDQSRTQACALFVASLLDLYMSDPRVILTMYTNPTHQYYGDLILVEPTTLVTSPSYYLYLFYADRFERTVLRTQTTTPTFSSREVGLIKAQKDVPTLVVSASKSADGQRLTALFINRSLEGSLETSVTLEGFTPTSTTCQILEAPANAINGSGLTETVQANSDIKSKPFACENATTQTISLPASSIMSLVAESSATPAE